MVELHYLYKETAEWRRVVMLFENERECNNVLLKASNRRETNRNTTISSRHQDSSFQTDPSECEHYRRIVDKKIKNISAPKSTQTPRHDQSRPHLFAGKEGKF